MGCQSNRDLSVNKSSIQFSIQLQYLRDLFPGKLLSSSPNLKSSFIKNQPKNKNNSHQNQSVFFLREFTSSTKQQHIQLKNCFQKYVQFINSQNNNEQLTRILRMKQSIVEQSLTMMCNGVYKHYILFQFSCITLQDQINARASLNKNFQIYEIWNIIVTGLSALNLVDQVQIFSQKKIGQNQKLSLKFKQTYYRHLFVNPDRILILEDGVLKFRDPLTLSFEDRHIRMKNFYYSPEKIADFTFRDDQKSAVFQLGMTVLHAILLQDCYDIYNGYEIDQQKLLQKINMIKLYYDDQWLIQVISKMVQIKRCKRFKIRQIWQLVNWVINGQQYTNDMEYKGMLTQQSQDNKIIDKQRQIIRQYNYKKVIASIPANIDCQMIKRSIQNSINNNMSIMSISNNNNNEVIGSYRMSMFNKQKQQKQQKQQRSNNKMINIEQNINNMKNSSSLMIFNQTQTFNQQNLNLSYNNDNYNYKDYQKHLQQSSYQLKTIKYKQLQQLYNSKSKNTSSIKNNIINKNNHHNIINKNNHHNINKQQYLYTSPQILSIISNINYQTKYKQHYLHQQNNNQTQNQNIILKSQQQQQQKIFTPQHSLKINQNKPNIITTDFSKQHFKLKQSIQIKKYQQFNYQYCQNNSLNNSNRSGLFKKITLLQQQKDIIMKQNSDPNLICFKQKNNLFQFKNNKTQQKSKIYSYRTNKNNKDNNYQDTQNKNKKRIVLNMSKENLTLFNQNNIESTK